MKFLQKFESYDSYMSREEMISYLCDYGCDVQELEVLSNDELMLMCKSCMEMPTNEAEQWIQKAIGKKGSLRKAMHKKEGEKITMAEINKEMKKLKEKDKDPKKPGVQGLNKKDLSKFRKLNLAKTLKGLKEEHETEHYMFFANLENMMRMCKELLEMDHMMVDQILSDGHLSLIHI